MMKCYRRSGGSLKEIPQLEAIEVLRLSRLFSYTLDDLERIMIIFASGLMERVIIFDFDFNIIDSGAYQI